MGTDPLGVILLAALTASAVLYWLLVKERLHRRRVDERMKATVHLAAVVRTHLADRRQSA